MKHFIIITGYANNPQQVEMTNQLAIKCKSKNSNYQLCYSTHYDPDPSFYRNFDFVLFNQNNPILNWDIQDRETITVTAEIRIDRSKKIIYPQPYHAYAHHISICDGMSIGFSSGYNTFTVLNSDCEDICIDAISEHFEYTNQQVSVFYNYGNEGINTEFFSFDRSFGAFFHSFRSYNKYRMFGMQHYEIVMKNICKTTESNVKVLDFPLKNTLSFGKMNFEKNEKVYCDHYFQPYLNIDDKFTYYIPYVDNNQKYLAIVNDNENVKIYINEEPIKTPGQYNILLDKIPISLKIEYKNKPFKHIYLHDSRQFGFITS